MRQPVRQFPEHDGVDAPERARREVGELVERCPTRQLPVQAVDHVHRGDLMIAGECLDQAMSEGLGFLLGYGGDHGHTPARSPLTNDPVSQEDEPVIDVGDMGFVHIQRQFQAVFQKGPAFFADGFGMCLGAFDDDDKIIGITAVGDSRLPLPVLSNRDGAPLLDAEIPGPAVLAGFRAQVFRLQPRIELMEHDVGQERRQDAALRNPFARRHEQATINVTCFQEPPEQIDEPIIPYPPPDAPKQQPMVNRVEVTRQIAFDDPATLVSTSPSCSWSFTVRTA